MGFKCITVEVRFIALSPVKLTMTSLKILQTLVFCFKLSERQKKYKALIFFSPLKKAQRVLFSCKSLIIRVGRSIQDEPARCLFRAKVLSSYFS